MTPISELRNRILELSANAMQEYIASAARANKPSKKWPKERWIQVCVARDLAKNGFLVDVEVPKSELEKRWKAKINKSQAIDLVIAEMWNSAPRLRALIEFKRDIWKERPRSDYERTVKALAGLKQVFGMIVVCHSDFDPEARQKNIKQAKCFAKQMGCTTIIPEIPPKEIVGGCQYYATVIGLVCCHD